MVSHQNSIAARHNNSSRTVWLATLLLLAVGVHVVFLAIVRQKPFHVLPHKHRSYVRSLAVQPAPPRNAKLLVVQVPEHLYPVIASHVWSGQIALPPATIPPIRAWPANSSSSSHSILDHGLLSGGCHQGMLTSRGYQTSFNIGEYLRQQYMSRYSLLSPHYNPNSLLAHATNNTQQATIDSLQTVVAALYPNASNASIQLDTPGSAPRKGSDSGITGTNCRKLVQLQRKLQQLQESKGGSTNSAEWQLLATRVQDLLLGLNRAINNITSSPRPADHAANTKNFAGAKAHAASLLQSMWRSASTLHDPHSQLQSPASSLDSLQDDLVNTWQLDLPGRKLLQQEGSSTAAPAVIQVPQRPHQTKLTILKDPPAVIRVPQRPQQTVPATSKVSPAVIKAPQQPHQTKAAIAKVSPAVLKVRSHQTALPSHKVVPAAIKVPQRPHNAVHSVPKAAPSASKKPVRRQQAVHTSRSSSAKSKPSTASRLAADKPLWDHFLDELTCIAARGDASFISSKARDILFYLEPWMLRNKLAIVAPGPKEYLSSRADCEQVVKLGVGRLVHEILLQWKAAISTAGMLKNDQQGDHQGETYKPGTEQTSQPNPRPLSWSDVMHVADPLQQPKLLLHGVEDTTLALLLRALGVQPTEWPPFSSHLELELWQHSVPSRNTSTSAPRYFVRIMYQGLPMRVTKQGTQLQGKLPYASRHADSSDNQLEERDFLCAYNSTSNGNRKCHSSNKAVGLPVVFLEELKALALGNLALDSKQYAVACGGGNQTAATNDLPDTKL